MHEFMGPVDPGDKVGMLIAHNWLEYFRAKGVPAGLIEYPDGRVSVWRDEWVGKLAEEPPRGSKLLEEVNFFDGLMMRVSWWKELHPHDYRLGRHKIDGCKCCHDPSRVKVGERTDRCLSERGREEVDRRYYERLRKRDEREAARAEKKGRAR